MSTQLKPYEQTWLDEYQEALRQKYAGVFDRLFTYDAADSVAFVPDYTLNVVVILKNGNRQTVKDVQFLGHSLAVLSEAVPFIHAYTEEDWQRSKKEHRLPFRQLPPERSEGHLQPSDCPSQPEHQRDDPGKHIVSTRLKPYEQTWLDEYQEALRQKYAGVFDRLFTYDRSYSSMPLPEYTVNVVLILKKGDRQTIEDITFLGHELAVLTEAIPFIHAYTEEDWQRSKKEHRLPFLRMPPEE